jgi:uncharacterized protein YcfL
MKSPSRSSPLVAALASSALFAACVSSGGPQNTYIGREGEYELEVQRANKALADALKIVDVRSERREERLLVQFELRNDLPRQLEVEYMLEWFDSTGFVIAQPQHWEPLVIGASGSKTISASAPTPATSSWKLAVRPRTAVR